MTVQVVRKSPGGFDANGDPITSTEARHALKGAAVAPRMSDDADGRGRRGVVVGLTLFLEAGTDILHTDHVEVDGTRYEVDGDIATWASPFGGGPGGIEVALRRARG